MAEISILELLCIPFLLLFGIATSYYDCKYRKIKNSWIAIALVYSVVALFISILIYKSKGIEINYEYVKLFFQNIGISLAFGFFLWLCNLWSAGDAKLFLAYAALMPLSVYTWGTIGLFPSYIILINTFTPLLFFFIIKVVISIKPKDFAEELLRSLNPKLLLSFAIFIFGFSFLNILFFRIFGSVQNNAALNALILFFIMVILLRLKINFMAVGTILCLLRVIFEFRSIITIHFLISFLTQLLFFVILIYFILGLGSRVFSKSTYIESLVPGMCLAEDIIFKNGKYMKVRGQPEISFLNSILNKLEKKGSVFSNATCLTNVDVAKIKQLHSIGKMQYHAISIYEKIYFALFMFIGVLLTIFFRGDFLISLKLIIESFI